MSLYASAKLPGASSPLDILLRGLNCDLQLFIAAVQGLVTDTYGYHVEHVHLKGTTNQIVFDQHRLSMIGASTVLYTVSRFTVL